MTERASQDWGHALGDQIALPGPVLRPKPLLFSLPMRTRPWALLISLATVGLSLSACGPRYRQETIGTGSIVLGPEGVPEGENAGVPVEGSPDAIMVQYQITMPRALQLHYAIECPGAKSTGVLGETGEAYTKRRQAELEVQRNRQVQTRANVVGAVVGQVQGSAAVQTPQGSAQVEAAADGQALGQSLAEQSTAPVQLSPLDTGARSLSASVQLSGGEAGTCEMKLWSELAGQDIGGVTAYYQVIRQVDKQREAGERRRERRNIALELRTRVAASLVAGGADPEHRANMARAARAAKVEAERVARQAQLDADRARREQARVREHVAVDLRVDVKVPIAEPVPEVQLAVPPAAHDSEIKVMLDQHHDAELKLRIRRRAARETRARVVAWLTSCGADPQYAVRLRQAELEAQDRQIRERYRVELEEKGRAQASLQLDMQTRAVLLAYLISNGADPYYRARLRQERFSERERDRLAGVDATLEARRLAELSVRVSLETRETLVAWLLANGADPEYRRKQNEAGFADFEVRSDEWRAQRVRDSLAVGASTEVSVPTGSVAVSGSALPPQPAPPAETPPPRPSADASWISGFYEVRVGQWAWVPGTWAQPPQSDAIWIPSVQVNLGGRTVVRPGSWRTSRGRRIEGSKGRPPARKAPGVRVRDHRRN